MKTKEKRTISTKMVLKKKVTPAAKKEKPGTKEALRKAFDFADKNPIEFYGK